MKGLGSKVALSEMSHSSAGILGRLHRHTDTQEWIRTLLPCVTHGIIHPSCSDNKYPLRHTMLESAQKPCCEQPQASVCAESTFHRVHFKKENVIDHPSGNVGVLLCLSQSLEPCSKSRCQYLTFLF